jgi:triacylglycerol lipase
MRYPAWAALIANPIARWVSPGAGRPEQHDVAGVGQERAGALDPRNPEVSPLFGSLAGLPPTYVFSGSLDLTIDAQRLRDRLLADGLTNFTFTLRNGEIHDYPISGFLPDAQRERVNIFRDLVG